LGNIEPSCQPSGGFPKFTRFPRPAAKKPQTKEVWFCDYRTNIHHTLKNKPLRFEDLQEFIELYNPENRHKHKETWHADNNPGGSWRKFSYKEITDRDQYSLDILSLKDAHMTDLDNLPAPEVIAEEIFEIIQVALASFREVANELKGDRNRLSS
jgi:type I restriction enzyme M protein